MPTAGSYRVQLPWPIPSSTCSGYPLLPAAGQVPPRPPSPGLWPLTVPPYTCHLQSLPAPAPSRPLPPCPLSPTTTLFPPLPHWSPASVSSTQVSFPPSGPSLEHTARSTSNTRSPSLVCFLFSPLECKPQAGILLSCPLCCVPSTSNSVWRELNAP